MSPTSSGAGNLGVDLHQRGAPNRKGPNVDIFDALSYNAVITSVSAFIAGRFPTLGHHG